MRDRPRNQRLGACGYRIALFLLEPIYRRGGLVRSGSRPARETLRNVRERLQRGETVHLVGLGIAGHNSGAALVRVSAKEGVRLLCNHEEERFSGEKHCSRFPVHSLQALSRSLAEHGQEPRDVAAWLASWDYPALSATLIRTVLEELPGSFGMIRPDAFPLLNARHMIAAARAPHLLAETMRLPEPVPVIAMPHHECHAWLSYCASPFAADGRPVIVPVVDGTGDRGAISVYLARRDGMELLLHSEGIFDSLGATYGFISSTQGGWTLLSSEGRFMGAAAYGDESRLTNRYYRMMRGLFSLGPRGAVHLNRGLARWPSRLFKAPYTARLAEMIGPPIPMERMWNPDAVLRVEDVDWTTDVQDRLDKAAALQLVFEDALFHVVDAAISMTGCDRVVPTGGTALNALANMRMLETFDARYFERRHDRRTRLQAWIPPFCGDAGAAPGAAYAFALSCGAEPGPPLRDAFHCGFGPTEREIADVLAQAPDIEWLHVGDARAPDGCAAVADMMAFVTARDGVLAIVRGAGETGPRALGHRSIVANACNPATRDILNLRVKFREKLRPLAPMMTLEAARRWFDLEAGAAAADYDAYAYMVLTARAKDGTRQRLPSVIHADGTARIQIVRPDVDPLIHGYLRALGHRQGVEVAVNTSFNVAGPIVQTADQAVATLRRAGGLDALLLFAEEGPVFAAWCIDAGQASRFAALRRDWLAERAPPLERNLASEPVLRHR